MSSRITIVLVIGALLVTSAARAQAPTDRGDAKALVQTGVKLIEAKDYLGALAIFKDAYTRYPSAKILLNIGTTLTLLDRKADAANAYQQYLQAPDTDPARKAEVAAVIAELDKAVGRLEITVTPPDAQLQFTDEWMPAANAKLWRVSPGTVSVRARRDSYHGGSTNVTVAPGEVVKVQLELTAIPKPTRIEIGGHRIEGRLVEGTVEAEAEPPRSRIGALAMVHVSVVPKVGSAWLVGATVDVIPKLAINAALLLGPGLVSDGMATLPPPSFGGYLGASFAFMTGKLRPRVGAGLPVFASDGARVFVRGAGGLEYVANRHVSLAIELGAEVALNPQDDIRELAVVPALGLTGRL